MNWNFEKIFDSGGRPLGGLAWDGSQMLFTDVNDSSIYAYDPKTNKNYPVNTIGISSL